MEPTRFPLPSSDACAAPPRARSSGAVSTRLSPRTLAWASALVCGLLVLAASLPVLEFDWLMFDDDINILVNPHLGARALESVPWAFENIDYMRRYLPLGWLGFAGLLAIDGYNAAVFHAANWLLTGLNAALIFFVFERLVRRASDAAVNSDAAGNPGVARRRVFAAAVAALVWSLHPLRVENVAWISGFLYVASTTLALAAVLLHLRAADASSAGKAAALRTLGALLYLGCVLVYPVHLALPAVLAGALAALSPTRFVDALRTEVKRTTGWWLAAAFSAGMNAFALATASESYASRGGAAAFTMWETAVGITRALAHYVAHTLWPNSLGVYYGVMEQWLSGTGQRVALIAAGVIAGALLFRKTTRRATLGWTALAALSFAPFLAPLDRNFQPNDRYAILWLAVWAIALARWLAHARPPVHARRWQLASLVLLLAFTVQYRRTLPHWKDTATLQAAIDRPNEDRNSVQLGYARAAMAFWFTGERAAMQRKLDDGVARFPNHPAIARTQVTLRDLDARWRQRVGTRLEIPPLAVLHVDLGRAWQARHAPAAASAHFARALRLAPDYIEAQTGWLQSNAFAR